MDERVESMAESRSGSALQACEESLALLVANIDDHAFVRFDARGCVADWNTGAQRITGHSRDEILGRHLSLFYSAADRAAGLPDQDLAHAREEGRYQTEGWRVRRDGSRFLARCLIVRLPQGGGPLRGYVQILRDSSAREQLEERFRRVVEAAPNAMVMASTSGVITMVNLQAERLFGYSRSEMLGQPVEMLVPERLRGHHPEMRRGFFTDPKSRPMGAGRDLYALRKDGSEFAVEIGLNPIATDEGMMVLAAIVDISDRKSKERRIEAALREKDILLGEIHHRVKNNMQIVHSLLDLQSTRIDDPQVLEMLRDTQNRIQSMALIHQTLYQSQDFSGVDFGHFIENLAPALASSYGSDPARIALSIDVEGVLLPLNAAIPCGLIVNELMTNALKHAFPDGRHGEIRIRLSREDDRAVCLTVSDTGVGIPESVDLASTTSLGIKLVTLLAEQLEGGLQVRRADPTEFKLRFPVTG